MGWTINWFKWRERKWMSRLKEVENDERPPGLDCYCHKQVALWGSLANEAQALFNRALGDSTLG